MTTWSAKAAAARVHLSDSDVKMIWLKRTESNNIW
jgi:hypothetical protein